MTNIDAYDILEEGGEYMIQILICDDNPLHSEEIQVMIQKLIPKDITVNYIKTKSKEESLNYIRKGQEHSWIIFMDILVQEMILCFGEKLTKRHLSGTLRRQTGLRKII